MDQSTDTPNENPSTAAEVSPPAASTPSPAKPRARRATSNNATRRLIELTLSVVSMKTDDRSLLATAAGADPLDIADVAESTVTRLDDVKAVLTAVSDIAKADQMEAGILATVLATEKKSLFRSAWRVLGQLSTGLPAQVPAASAAAGLAFGKAAQSLDDPGRKSLSRLLKDLGA